MTAFNSEWDTPLPLSTAAAGSAVSPVRVYIEDMKRVTASEARGNWFRLLDEVAAGAAIVIEWHDCRIVLSREAISPEENDLSDYASIIRVPDAERADEWSWDWPGEEGA
jgi:hypothetical protein